MNPVVSLSTKLYRLLARLYPDDIRRRWEPEMADTFALQLSDAVSAEQWSSVLAAWYYALADLVVIALPLQLARTALIVSVTAVAGAGAMFCGLVWALGNSLVLRDLYHQMLGRLGG
jgi:hypothetical protein